MGRMDGKVALITGGARGQGAAEAKLFAAEGAAIVLTDVLDDDGKATAAACGGHYLHHDVTSEDQWRSVVDATLRLHGRVDVLVNNAGIFKPGTLATTISSIAGLRGGAGSQAYTASKWAVRGMTTPD